MPREPKPGVQLVRVEFEPRDITSGRRKFNATTTFWFKLTTDGEERVTLPVCVAGAAATTDELFLLGQKALRDLLSGWLRVAEKTVPPDTTSE